MMLPLLICLAAASAANETSIAYYESGPRPHKGEAQGTLDALTSAQEQLIICGTPGCAALVSLQPARRLSRAAGHGSIAPGAGCGSM